jgi:hypothetical protein
MAAKKTFVTNAIAKHGERRIDRERGANGKKSEEA